MPDALTPMSVDPALASLLADPRVALRPPPPDVPLVKVRAAANAFMARAKGPSAVEVTSHEAPGRGGRIAVRCYRPAARETRSGAVLVFVHGGGFVFGDLDSHDATCRTLAIRTGALVVALNYRLAPEAPFPAACDDVEDVLQWLRRHPATVDVEPDRLALAGDSAGGQLATAAALREVAAGRSLRHLALIYPLVDPSCSTGSARRQADGPMLTASFLKWAWQCYRGSEEATAGDPLYDLTRADLRGLPSTTIVTAACDPLCDEGEALAARLERADVPVALRRFDGMIHGFVGLPDLTSCAAEALDLIGGRLVEALGTGAPGANGPASRA